MCTPSVSADIYTPPLQACQPKAIEYRHAPSVSADIYVPLLKVCQSLASQPYFRFQTHPLGGDKPFTQAFENWDRDAWEQWQSYVQSQFSEWALTYKPQEPWTD